MVEKAEFPQVQIVDVRPQLGCGRYAVKRIEGETLLVTADIIKEGHDTLVAEVRYRLQGDSEWRSSRMTYFYNEDEWSGEIPLTDLGYVEYTVASWVDPWATWAEELRRKVAAGRDVTSELLEGAQFVRDAAAHADPQVRPLLEEHAEQLSGSAPQPERVHAALLPEMKSLMETAQRPEGLSTYDSTLLVSVDRERARFGSWYEFFPRSHASAPCSHGTFREAESRLPGIRELGFNVIYLPPIYPIGKTNRKGRNNALVAHPGDPGSPWAIGNEHGGHDAVNPELGTIEDFDHFLAAAKAEGLEIALDFAIQCSPDHPYVREHPEWFRRRPDGTIKYAENPPKRYEDIVALDMWCEDYPALWEELRRVVMFWVKRGVRIFRVDNPHTKPLAFWGWLIPEVRREYPDTIFLAEAFTRPKKLQLLAKLGFSQSYTYYTWRNSRHELEEYLTDLTRSEQAEYLRPNFFANTPDILHEYLQHGGKPAFKIRLVLAATLSPTYGIYSGYELCENTPVRPGSEEYLDSEKYQIRQRDFSAPGNLNEYIRCVNEARRANPALQLYTNLRFHYPDNPSVMAYSKSSEDGSNRLLVVVNTDPHHTQEATVHLDGGVLGLGHNSRYRVHDLLTGSSWEWHGISNYVRLDPHYEPAHMFRIEEL